jgi:Mn-dependent DtxR family transcriptional regulator
MTREFLGMMLEVHPAGVSGAAKLLQKVGLIRYERGQITVTDRLGLEAAACECYGAMRRALERLQEQRTGAPHSMCN